MPNSTINRGAFIVFEGCDRCGKSTQCRLLFEFLQKCGVPAKHMVFPERKSTSIGQTINAYLTSKQQMSDEAIHLLFTANRWEYQLRMKELLLSGTTLIVDRYSYSGIAYSAAKGLNYDWCMMIEKGLIRPDIVYYLKMNTIGALSDRMDFGNERYENQELQIEVARIFDQISQNENDYWQVINAQLTKEFIHEQIISQTQKLLRTIGNKELAYLN